MDTWLSALKLDLIVSIPQSFVTMLLVFSFLRPRPERLFRRVLLVAVIHSVYTDTFIMFVPVYLQLVNSLVALAALLLWLFPELSFRKKIFLYFGGIVSGIVSDTIMLGIASGLGDSNVESLRKEQLPELVSIMYPELLLIAVAAWFIRRKMAKKPLNLAIDPNGNRTSFKVLGLIVAQFVVLGFIITVQFSSESDNSVVMSILIYATIVVSLSAIVFLLRMMTITRAEAIRSTQALYVDDINHMFTSVRGQRHDFLNHVQVIHAMAQMGKYDQLKAYTATLVQETREVSDIVNHASPALAAFAKAKTTVALGRGIAFRTELPSKWNVPDTEINTLDLIKILGNLVDNAFDESMALPIEQRSVLATVRADDRSLTLLVENRGRPIEPEVRARMFEDGFSTKGEGHSGLGLAIVRERVGHYRGELRVDSDAAAGTTAFTIRLPIGDSVAG